MLKDRGFINLISGSAHAVATFWWTDFTCYPCCQLAAWEMITEKGVRGVPAFPTCSTISDLEKSCVSWLPRPVLLTLEPASGSPGRLVKTWVAGPHPTVSDSVGFEWAWECAFLTAPRGCWGHWSSDHTLKTIDLWFTDCFPMPELY